MKKKKTKGTSATLWYRVEVAYVHKYLPKIHCGLWNISKFINNIVGTYNVGR